MSYPITIKSFMTIHTSLWNKCQRCLFLFFSYTYIIFCLYLSSNKPISRFVRHRGTQTESGISKQRCSSMSLLFHLPATGFYPCSTISLKKYRPDGIFYGKSINIYHKNKGKSQLCILSAKKCLWNIHNPLFPMRNIMLPAYLEGIFILTCTPCEFKTRTGVFSLAFK